MNPLQEQLLAILQNFVGSKNMSADDNIFDLGLDSVQAILFLEQIEQIFGCSIPVNQLLIAPTIEMLAEFVAGETRQPDA